MKRETKLIELPVSKIKVALYGWIPAGDGEYVDAAMLGAVKMGTNGIPGVPGSTVTGSVDTASAVKEGARRKFEVYVARIEDGETKIEERSKIVAWALENMPSDDYEHVLSEIEKIEQENKKKLPAPATTEPTKPAA